MPQWNDFVDRFRPAGTPGAAARPGVPADRSAEAAAELTPLLALLDDTQDEVERIRSAAAERADEILRAAHRQTDQIAAQARADAESVRAQAGAEARDGAVAVWSKMEAETATEIECLQARVGDRMPYYVDKVAAAAREWLDQPSQQPKMVTDA